MEKKKVFISYSRSSEGQVKELIDDIQKLGLEAMSDRNLPGGQPWWERILNQIEVADLVIIAIDETFSHSIAVGREYEYARALNIPVLPIVVAGDIRPEKWPAGLDDLQWVDYRGEHRDGALHLGRALGSIPDRGPMPEAPPKRPPVPKSDLDRLNEKIASSEPLNHADQSSLVIALKSKLLVPHEAQRAVSILEEFRNREDLLKSIDRVIEEALATAPKFQEGDDQTDGRTPEPPPPPPPPSVEKYGYGEHALGGAVAGFFLGLVLGGMVETGIGFAVIGAVIGLIVALISPIKKKPETSG